MARAEGLEFSTEAHELRFITGLQRLADRIPALIKYDVVCVGEINGLLLNHPYTLIRQRGTNEEHYRILYDILIGEYINSIRGLIEDKDTEAIYHAMLEYGTVDGKLTTPQREVKKHIGNEDPFVLLEIPESEKYDTISTERLDSQGPKILGLLIMAAMHSLTFEDDGGRRVDEFIDMLPSE